MQTFCGELLFGVERNGAGRLAGFKDGDYFTEHIALRDELFVSTFGIPLHTLQSLLGGLHVREDELKVYRLDIAQRVHVSRYMVYVFVVEHTDDFGYRIYFADVREKLVAEPLPLRSTFYQTRDIHEFHRGRHFLCRMGHVGELVEPEIRDRDDSHRRVDGAKRIILRRYPLLGECIEQRGFANVW